MKNDELRGLNLDGWPLSDDYLREVGRVSVLWAELESLLNVLVGKLAGFSHDDQRWFVLVNHASFPQRLDMLGSLCGYLVDSYPSLSGYQQVVSTLKSAQAIRNKFMHHGMAPNAETGEVEMAVGSARGSVKVKVEAIEATDIRRAALQIHDAMRALYKLVLGKDIPSVAETRKAKRS
jgi:hypothetical protein